MGSLEPAMLILGVIGAIGAIELLIWIVVIIRNPGFDELRTDLTPNAPPHTPEYPGTSWTVTA